ncbi:hypothetical protein HK096_005808, partial [Nowakowskiella sp. JEL0078]
MSPQSYIFVLIFLFLSPISLRTSFLLTSAQIVQNNSTLALYFPKQKNITYVDRFAGPCTSFPVNGIVDDYGKCRAVLTPGKTITIGFNFQELIGKLKTSNANSSVVAAVTFKIVCGFKKYSPYYSIYLNNDIKWSIVVPGNGTNEFQMDSGYDMFSADGFVCWNMSPQVEMQFDVYQVDDNYKILLATYNIQDFSKVQFTYHLLLNVSNVFSTGQNNISKTYTQLIDNPYFLAFFCTVLSVLWFSLLAFAYISKAKIYGKTKSDFLEDVNKSSEKRKALLSQLVTKQESSFNYDMKKIENFAIHVRKILQARSEDSKSVGDNSEETGRLNDDFYGRPPDSLINKLGSSGWKFKILNILNPWSVLKLGVRTLIESPKGSLHLLPKYLGYK